MARFLLLSMLIAFAVILIVTSPQAASPGFAVGVVLAIVGMFGYITTFATWLKPHI
jgi:hypothetical protein